MKKKWFKRILCEGLALALAVCLCACGGGKKEKPGELSVDSGGVDVAGSAGIFGNADTVPANAMLAKENVYRVSEIAIPELTDSGISGVECTAHSDCRIYACLKITDWENGNQYCVLSMDEAGNVLHTVFLELPGDDARYTDFVIGAEGRIYALRQYYFSYLNELTGQSQDEQHQYICCWDGDGRLLWELEPGDSGEDNLNVWAIFPAGDGSLELLLTDENQKNPPSAYKVSIERDGSFSDPGKEKLSEETFKVLGNCRRLIRKEDGSCLLICRNGGEGLSFMTYDFQGDTLGEAFAMPDDLPANSLSSMVFSSDTDSDLIYADKRGVFSMNMGDAQSSLKMNYVNSDRNITDALSLLALDETHFFMFYKEDYTKELKAGIFAYVEPEDIPDKAVVVLAGLALDGGMRKRAIQYNRENDRYRIVLKEYGSRENLNLDIVSGKMPDILMAEGLPMESYIAKGLIADVGMLIEADEELSRIRFMENVFDAYSVDGKLRYVIPSFGISTMAAKASLVGDGDDWCMEKMIETLKEMGKDACLLDGLSRTAFIEKAMRYSGNDLIDMEAGKCFFDSQGFIEMMKFAYTLPEEKSYAAQRGEGEYELQYLKDRTLLLELNIWTFLSNVDERICYRLNGYLGGDYTLVGFPAVSGKAAGKGKALICAENLMALSAGSENLDGAWDFARYYLTDEYQKSLEISLPVCKQNFEEWAREEMLRSYYIDENGERVEYDLTLYQDGELVVVPPLDEEQLEQLIAYVESATATPFENDDVMNIINEELGSYFSGQMAAEDVAAIIQNRVQLYVRENQL